MSVETSNATRVQRLGHEQRFELLVNAVTDYAISMMDADGTVATWNAGAERIKGYTAGEIIGGHFSRFYTEEDRASRLPARALTTAAETGRHEAEGWLVRKDGTRFWASVVIDPVRDADGALIGFAEVTRDITEQHNARIALQHAQERLAQSRRMEALAQLTGGIAHDFNNLLMIVSGHCQLLTRRLTEPGHLQSIEAIKLAALRGESLTRQLVRFSRRHAFDAAAVDLHQHIESVRELLASSLRGNIQLVVDLSPEIWPVEVDGHELDLAIVNIALNARDAMPNGGAFTITAQNVIMEPERPDAGRRGEFVALSLRDTGTGIPPDILPRIFEPFFTTKDVGAGTGLGLSQVHGFAYQSGGMTDVASDLGKGTTVTIYLPRSPIDLVEKLSTHADADPQAPSSPILVEDHPDLAKVYSPAICGRILMVEDNPDVAKVAKAMLKQLGYSVVRVGGAARALAALDAGRTFDLVFSDIVMPGGFNGVDLAREIHRRYPRLPVLLTTGYNRPADEAHGGLAILRKPYQLSTLARAIRETIASYGDRGRPAAFAR